VRTLESSRHEGRPIHRALIQQLKDSEHASGATVLRAIWGFRGAERPHGDRFLQLVRHVPVTTVILDTAANIAASYPIVDELTEREGLVTCEALPALLEVHAGRTHGALDLGDDSPE
jgi:PII-like signaling protein